MQRLLENDTFRLSENGTSGPHLFRYLWFYWSDFDKIGLILKLRSSSVGLASPRVPASPREASSRVQKVRLVPALVTGVNPVRHFNISVG